MAKAKKVAEKSQGLLPAAKSLQAVLADGAHTYPIAILTRRLNFLSPAQCKTVSKLYTKAKATTDEDKKAEIADKIDDIIATEAEKRQDPWKSKIGKPKKVTKKKKVRVYELYVSFPAKFWWSHSDVSMERLVLDTKIEKAAEVEFTLSRIDRDKREFYFIYNNRKKALAAKNKILGIHYLISASVRQVIDIED
jgi:hypothetical protein